MFNFRTQAGDTDSSMCVAEQRSGVDSNLLMTHRSMRVFATKQNRWVPAKPTYMY